jgi:hypothetical protein
MVSLQGWKDFSGMGEGKTSNIKDVRLQQDDAETPATIWPTTAGPTAARPKTAWTSVQHAYQQQQGRQKQQRGQQMKMLTYIFNKFNLSPQLCTIFFPEQRQKSPVA